MTLKGIRYDALFPTVYHTDECSLTLIKAEMAIIALLMVELLANYRFKCREASRLARE